MAATSVWQSITICTLAIGFHLVGARAAEINFVAPAEDKVALITVVGRLELGDERRFIDQALAAEQAIVFFSSEGGNLVAGMEIGKAIRLKGFTTYVAKGVACASACALAWLGGRVRGMSEGSLIGFHAASAGGGVTSIGNAMVGAYLNQLGLPVAAVVYITEASPDDIRWLTFSDAQKVGIEVRQIEIPETPGANAKAESKASPESLSKNFIVAYFKASEIANDRVLAAAQPFYADSVFYYSKAIPRDALLSDKESFFRRWDTRNYRISEADLNSTCGDDSTCLVTGIAGWFMHSSMIRSFSEGTASIEYRVSFSSGKPLIVSEFSRVLSRKVWKDR